MRVKCRSCGRKFDYEGCGGMCPKCASYYQIDYKPEEDMFGDRFESRNEYTSNVQETSSYEEPQENYSYQYVGEKRNTPQLKKSKMYTCFLVVLMVVIMIVPFFVVQLADVANSKREEREIFDADNDETAEEDIMQITPLSLGDAFPYEAVNNYNYEGVEEHIFYDIRITGAKTDEELQGAMPEGYEMLAVSYEITEEDRSRLYSIYTNTYLLTKGGQYLYPVENYRMEELLGCDQKGLETRGIDSEFSYSNGFLYFMVKKGDAAGLRIFCQKYDYENYQMEGIYAGYEIAGLGGENDE